MNSLSHRWSKITDETYYLSKEVREERNYLCFTIAILINKRDASQHGTLKLREWATVLDSEASASGTLETEVAKVVRESNE